MARRLIYDPGAFVEASTPFFDNIVGTIQDQADRISRNVARQREERAVAEERAFQVGLVKQRQSFQAAMQEDAQQFQGEMQDEQLQFQGEQNRIQMKMEDMQHLDMMDYRRASLQQKGWLDFLSMRSKAGDMSQEMKDLQRRVQERIRKLKGSALLNPSEPSQFYLAPNEDGQPIVAAPGIQPMGYNEFMEGSKYKLLENVADHIGGQTVEEFAKTKLYDAESNFAVQGVNVNGETITRQGEDTLVGGDGTLYIGADSFRNLVYAVRDGIAEPEQVNTLQKLMSNDSGYQFAYKQDEKAERWDQQRISTVVENARGALGMVQSHTGSLFTIKGEMATEFTTFKELFPNVININNPLNPEQTIPAKTLGDARQAVVNQYVKLSQESEDWKPSTNPLFEHQFTATEGLYNTAVQTISEYKDSMGVPEQLKGKSASFLASIARVNQDEFNKPSPDPTKLFTWDSYDDDQLQEFNKMNSFDLYSEVGSFINARNKEEAKRQAIQQYQTFLQNPGLY